MKRIRKLMLIAITSTLFLSGCSSSLSKSNHPKELAISQNEVDPIEEKLEQLLTESIIETEEWFEANKDSYKKYDEELEIEYFKYNHCYETFHTKRRQLKESTAILNYIDSHYYAISRTYEYCFDIVSKLMDQKYNHNADKTAIHDMYVTLEDILENSTEQEQRGFIKIIKTVSEILDTAYVMVKYSPFHLTALTISIPLVAYAFANAYDSFSPQDKENVDAFKARFPDFQNILVFLIETRKFNY